MTIREDITNMISDSLKKAQSQGDLPQIDVESPSVDRPQDAGNGDYACSLPLKLARDMRMNPLQIAEKIVEGITVHDAIEKVWAARPGFINFTLKESWLADQVEDILEKESSFGNVTVGAGTRMQVEFISGNPTGPLHVGHVRGAVFGSVLSSVLSAAGYDIQREFYVNDSGNQIDQFSKTVLARYKQSYGEEAEIPPDGYVGDYMIDLAAEIKSEQGDKFLAMPVDEALTEIGDVGLNKMLDAIREDVTLLNVEFDEWFSERTLYKNGQYEHSMKTLRDSGHTNISEGAEWFTATSFGEEKDAVLIRNTGVPTYFASDVAYHYNKLVERKFDHVVNVWGADHQGHVARMRAVVEALGVAPERLTLAITQIVTLRRGGEVVRLSKRTGEIITLRELVDEVGADACRFFFLSRAPESQMDFDMELAKEQSNDNPVYYVQYAHARIASILRLAAERSIDHSDGDLSLLTHEAELALIRKMLQLPELIEMMARNLEVHHLPHYSQELANSFHWFYQNCRVVSGVEGDEEITKARLRLALSAKTVFARCLSLMGMSAPEEM